MSRVLVVDDDPDIRSIVQFQLRQSGHRVAAVESAAAAEALVDDRGAPDVAVIDVMLPDVDGFELLRRLRERDGLANLPVIFLSAKVLPEDIAHGQSLGAQYLTKPFVASALLTAIDRAVSPVAPGGDGEW